MSIISSIIADHSNKQKEEWVSELKTAYEEKDWDKVKILIDKMEKFYFSE